MSKYYDPNAKVELRNDNGIGRTSTLSIGDLMIPFYEATMTIRADESVTITARVRADRIDVKALQENTRLIIDAPDEAGDV